MKNNEGTINSYKEQKRGMDFGLVNHLKQQSLNFFNHTPLLVKHFPEQTFKVHVPTYL